MDGAADLVGPVDLGVADAAMQLLAEKRWCLIGMQEASSPELAKNEAEGLPGFTSLPVEVTPEYLGQGGRGKVLFLDDAELSKFAPDSPLVPFLVSFYEASEVVAGMASETLVSASAQITSPMLHLPYDGPAEALRLKPRHLTEDDDATGALTGHVDFIRRRKLCLIYWLDTEGADFRLLPRPDSEWSEVEVAVVKNSLLIFDCDCFSFTHDPIGSSVVLQSWVLGPLARQETEKESEGTLQTSTAESGLLEVMRGPGTPLGDRVHIKAITCRINGDITNKEAQLHSALAGTDGFVEFPLARFDTELYCTTGGEKADGKSYVRHAGLLPFESLLLFDADFFGCTAEEASDMAPCQRSMLEVGYECLYYAGYTKETVNGQYIGHYVGDTGAAMNEFFPAYMMWEVARHKDGRYGHSNGVTATRLSYMLGLRGPNGSMDTACSAALVGVCVAVNYMRATSPDQGKVRLGKSLQEAVCMGVNNLTSIMNFIALCGPSMLSPGGRCFTFDETADGYARGEAVDAMFLRYSSDDKDRDEQLGCLVGSHSNQDGRSASLTAPNGPAQQMAIRASMQEAGMEPLDVTMSECHGTGTALGDPIEVGAIKGVVSSGHPHPLYLGSAKTNAGHTEAAAGLTGLCKCVAKLSCSSGTPNIHLGSLNPHLEVEGFPCYFQTEAADTALTSGFCGVSSFGFGGTNARGDVWAESDSMHRNVFVRELQAETILRRKAVCPVTLAPMDAITGEPYLGEESHSDAIREEFASYDVSAFAYQGEYRYRRQPLSALDTDASNGRALCLCSSASEWKVLQPMTREADGWYVAQVVLGEARRELFYICLASDKQQAFFPVIGNASRSISAKGPEENSKKHYWVCDGRDDSLPTGTAFEIRFRWGELLKQVTWQVVTGTDVSLTEPLPAASYSISGSPTSNSFIPMRSVAGSANTWKHSFRIGLSGQEEFFFARSEDPAQMIYPPTPGDSSSFGVARGPDDLCNGKRFMVEGAIGESAMVFLQVEDGRITIKAHLESGAMRQWESVSGWARHQYGVLADNSNEAVPMVMHSPGKFHATIRVQERAYDTARRCWQENFRIIMDSDLRLGYFPALPDAKSGESIVYGPIRRQSSSNSWMVRSQFAGVDIDVWLDLTVSDRRQMVTFAKSAQQ